MDPVALVGLHLVVRLVGEAEVVRAGTGLAVDDLGVLACSRGQSVSLIVLTNRPFRRSVATHPESGRRSPSSPGTPCAGTQPCSWAGRQTGIEPDYHVLPLVAVAQGHAGHVLQTDVLLEVVLVYVT